MTLQRTGQIATGFIGAMKEQPVALALVLVIFTLIGFAYFQGSQFNAQRKENVALFVEMQKEVQKLLSQCLIPAQPK